MSELASDTPIYDQTVRVMRAREVFAAALASEKQGDLCRAHVLGMQAGEILLGIRDKDVTVPDEIEYPR